jgi:hypothetical protein
MADRPPDFGSGKVRKIINLINIKKNDEAAFYSRCILHISIPLVLFYPCEKTNMIQA